MIRASFTNLAATATVTASSDAGGDFTKDNIKSPQRPMLTGRTTVATDSWWVIDHGSAKSVDMWGLINTNFTSCKIQANAADAWGAPTYDSGTLTIGQSPLNDRYHLGHRRGVVTTFRYNRIFVPAQTPTDGAAYFSLGGVWAGALTSPTKDTLFLSWRDTSIRPFIDIGPDASWTQRLILGDTVARFKATVRAAITLSAPGVADEWGSWITLFRSWWNAGYGMVSLFDQSTAWTHIMRLKAPPQWDLSLGTYAETDLEIEEVLRP